MDAVATVITAILGAIGVAILAAGLVHVGAWSAIAIAAATLVGFVAAFLIGLALFVGNRRGETTIRITREDALEDDL